jgi:hypothetical protein
MQKKQISILILLVSAFSERKNIEIDRKARAPSAFDLGLPDQYQLENVDIEALSTFQERVTRLKLSKISTPRHLSGYFLANFLAGVARLFKNVRHIEVLSSDWFTRYSGHDALSGFHRLESFVMRTNGPDHLVPRGLEKFASLTHLEVPTVYCTDQMTALTKLRLMIPVPSWGGSMHGCSIANLVALESLDISAACSQSTNHRPSYWAFQDMQNLSRLTNLTELTIQNCGYMQSDVSIDGMALPKLRRLNLEDTFLTDATIQALQARPNLEFTYGVQQMSEFVAHEVIKASPELIETLMKMTALTNLELPNADMGDDQVKTLVDAFIVNGVKLESLKIHSVALHDAGVQALTALTSLTRLSVSGPSLTDQAFINFTSLKFLRVSSLSLPGPEFLVQCRGFSVEFF